MVVALVLCPTLTMFFGPGPVVSDVRSWNLYTSLFDQEVHDAVHINNWPWFCANYNSPIFIEVFHR